MDGMLTESVSVSKRAEYDDFLEECDLCHDYSPIRQIKLTQDGQFLCQKCREIGLPFSHCGI